MKRRDLITTLLLSTFSSAASAQQHPKPYRIVILNLTLRTEDLHEFGPFPQYTALFRELRRNGFDEKQNLVGRYLLRAMPTNIPRWYARLSPFSLM